MKKDGSHVGARSIKARGKLRITDEFIWIELGTDFAAYYRWHVFKHTGIWANLPARMAHVSIYNPNVHRTKPRKVTEYQSGDSVEFFYVPSELSQNRARRGHLNWIFEVYGEELWTLIYAFGMQGEFGDRWVPHLTVCNTKGSLSKNPLLKNWLTISTDEKINETKQYARRKRSKNFSK